MSNRFYPLGSVSVSATSSSAATAMPASGSSIRVVRVQNAARVFIRFGTSAALTVTTSNGMEILPGIVEDFSNEYEKATYFALITDGTTTGVNVSVGPTFG